MTCGELIAYLGRFAPEEKFAVIAVDVQQRVYFNFSGYDMLDEHPALILEAVGCGSLDDVMEEEEGEE